MSAVRGSFSTTATTYGQLPADAYYQLSAPGVINGPLEVTGNLKIDGTSELVGSVTCDSTLSVTGATTLSGTASIGGSATIGGGATIGGNLAVTGSLTAGNSAVITGSLTCSGDIDLSGQVVAGGNVTANALKLNNDSNPLVPSSQLSTVLGVLELVTAGGTGNFTGQYNMPYTIGFAPNTKFFFTVTSFSGDALPTSWGAPFYQILPAAPNNTLQVTMQQAGAVNCFAVVSYLAVL